MFSKNLIINKIKIFQPDLYTDQIRKEWTPQSDDFATLAPYSIADEPIPQDPAEFYQDFGKLIHPYTGQEVQQLTEYQYNISSSPARNNLVVKSQKVGITTSVLLDDFRISLTPNKGRGRDILIVGQTDRHASEHLQTLKRMIVDSQKYRKYLITQSKELFFKEEKTKVGILYIKNPSNPFRPSRIIGLPPRESALWSWKNVYRIHMSDIAAANMLDDSGVFAAAFSRLANTNGEMVIESPPRGQRGKFYELHELYKDGHNADFKVWTVLAEDGKKAGLISQEFLDAERERLGALYPQYYGGSFLVATGNIFTEDEIAHAELLGEIHKHKPINPYMLHPAGVDWGFGSSKSAIYVGEIDEQEQTCRIIYGKSYENSTPSFIAAEMHRLYREIPNVWFFVDGSNRGAVNEAKTVFDEDLDWERAKDVSPTSNRVLPVNFKGDHKDMLFHAYNLVSKGHVPIPKEYIALTKSLRSAWATDYDIDKDMTSHNDDLDAFRLMLKGVQFETT